VRLVDAGVFDNQGVATLHEQECQVMLVNDSLTWEQSNLLNIGVNVTPRGLKF